MTITLNDEQLAELNMDKYVTIELGSCQIYIERYENFYYFEWYEYNDEGERVKCVAFDTGDLAKLEHVSPVERYKEELVCPSCNTAVGDYKYNCCPKCGQRLKWTGRSKF